jgi:surface polysaccharide O-acyltransferase-like enzyme
MISGHQLLSKEEPLKVFFRKRFDKVVIPLVVWSVFYVFWRVYYEGGAEMSFYSFYSIALSPAYYHLLFLYIIIGVYLFVPILRVLARQSDDVLLYCYVILWFVAVSIIPLGEKIVGSKSGIDLSSFSGFSGYLVLGMLLGKMTITGRIAGFALTLSLACLIITVTGTHFLTVRNAGTFSGSFYGYLTPNVVAQSAATFLLIKYAVINVPALSHERFLSIIRSISSASLGIYLIHTVFLYVLNKGSLGFTMNGFQWHPIISIPLTAVTAFLLSFVSISLLRKIPVAKRIAP